jgi:hypothetical protein
VAWRREQAQLLRETNSSQTKDSYYTEISRHLVGIIQYSLMEGWRTSLWALVQIVNKFRKKNPFPCPWDFGEQNYVLESSLIIVNYCIVINACYNYIINALYNYIVNKSLLEECGKEENADVTGAATTSCLRGRL